MTMLRHQNGHPLRTFDGMVNRVFSDMLAADAVPGRAPESLPLDLWEQEDAWSLALDVPGCRLDDLHLTLQDGTLSIRGERAATDPQGARAHRRERHLGQFLREVILPGDVDAERIEATLEAGVLSVRLPKAAESRPRRIDVKSVSKD